MTLRLDIWSDLACPWCYVGKRRLEAALAEFEHAAAVSIHWRSFQLDPSAPRQLDDDTPYAERLARKYRVSSAQGQAMIDRMTETAAAEGITMRFDRVRPGNTFDAHRLLHLAATHGQQGVAKERLLRAYQCDGEALGDPATLVRLATELGLDEAEVTAMLEGDRFAADVRTDLALARELGITGVPFFVLGGRLGVSGAQPAGAMLDALRQAWAAAPAMPATTADGAACGPDGCA
ncbi:MAG: DsbA family oxidoreductase [Kofleriaceae bacterium]